MNESPLKVVRSSGNVFADLGIANPEQQSEIWRGRLAPGIGAGKIRPYIADRFTPG